jgi:hypothetical protein
MFKSLLAPARLFQLATWAVSFVFASFLIGLGSKVVSELPGVDQRLSVEEFIDTGALAQVRQTADSLERAQAKLYGERERANLTLEAASNAYHSQREAFDNWIATRNATTDPAQDPQVLSRTRALDLLKGNERRAQETLEAIDGGLLEVQQAMEQNYSAQQELRTAAAVPYERAVFRMELRVFGVRLLITLPLLLLAIWLFTKKRTSKYWPLGRGFVLFALFAFFFELVPYLPSYGGYVRYIVGIVLTAVTGLYVIRAMQRYVAKRAEAAELTETERRQTLGYEEAMKQMSNHLCPGCERQIVGGPQDATNFCVHCGMMLFNDCGKCETRKNAFFQYCPTCGVPAVAGQGA